MQESLQQLKNTGGPVIGFDDACCVQESQLSETLSTCRFAQRMMQVTVDAQKNKGGMSSVHGNLFKLDPVMQQYLEVCQGFTCYVTH